MQAKKLIFLLLILSLKTALLFSDYYIDPEEYVVKANDVFLLQTVVPDTLSLKIAVLPTGEINLFPIADTVKVAGKTLSQAYIDINERLGMFTKKQNIQTVLMQIAPFSFSVSGAVNRAGEYSSKEQLSLYQALRMAGGLNGKASNEITIKRNEKEIKCDLAKFLAKGEQSHNPLIFHNDIIVAKFAFDSESLRVYTNNDTINYVESIVLDSDTPISKVINMMSLKYPNSNYDKFTLVRDGKTKQVSASERVRNSDKLIISQDDVFVYVVGSVAKPGRYAYNGIQNPIHYVGLAGGFTKDASRTSFVIIDKNGKRNKYKGQAINQGDTIFVPESTRAITVAYLIPLSTVVSVISTIIILSR